MQNFTKNLTIQLGNYNGFRNPIRGKGRLEITIESVLETCPFVPTAHVLLIDNESTDGSQDYLYSLPFGQKLTYPRLHKEEGWYATTTNNMNVLKKTILQTQTPYLWRIENDSYFYNRTNFLERALVVLDYDPQIAIIHLRRWTRLDAFDLPGVGRNINRVEEVRNHPLGFAYYLLQQLEQETLWVPVHGDLGENFIPDQEEGYGKCPVGKNVVGAIRFNQDGQAERLLNEHWNSYTNHGWVARTDALRFIVTTYNPLNEREFSKAFKKHFRAGKIDQDAFVAFGWRTRGSYSTKEIIRLFQSVKKHNYTSIRDYGLLNYVPHN